MGGGGPSVNEGTPKDVQIAVTWFAYGLENADYRYSMTDALDTYASSEIFIGFGYTDTDCDAESVVYQITNGSGDIVYSRTLPTAQGTLMETKKPSGCYETVSIEGWTEGTYTVSCQVTDANNNKSSTVTYPFKVVRLHRPKFPLITIYKDQNASSLAGTLYEGETYYAGITFCDWKKDINKVSFTYNNETTEADVSTITWEEDGDKGCVVVPFSANPTCKNLSVAIYDAEGDSKEKTTTTGKILNKKIGVLTVNPNSDIFSTEYFIKGSACRIDYESTEGVMWCLCVKEAENKTSVQNGTTKEYTYLKGFGWTNQLNVGHTSDSEYVNSFPGDSKNYYLYFINPTDKTVVVNYSIWR